MNHDSIMFFPVDKNINEDKPGVFGGPGTHVFQMTSYGNQEVDDFTYKMMHAALNNSELKKQKCILIHSHNDNGDGIVQALKSLLKIHNKSEKQ